MIGFGPLQNSYALSRNLQRSTQMISQALLRLGSGQRVNSPRDGTLDFARMVGLESQARGLSQAMSNVTDAQGVTETADSALASMLEVAQSIRELAIEAQDSSLTVSERDALQEEASALLDELKSYVSNTEYNSRSLLDGTFSSVRVQAFPGKSGAYSFSIGDARTSTLGRLAIISGGQGDLNTNAFSSTLYVTLNGVAVAGSDDDGVSNVSAAGSALAKVNAINRVSNQTGVYAEVVGTERTIVLEMSATAYLDNIGTGEFKINGVEITGAAETASEFVGLVNNQTTSTGVVATLVSANQVKFTAADGRNIDFSVSNGAGNGLWDALNNPANNTIIAAVNISASLSTGATSGALGGAIRLWSAEDISIAASGKSAVGITAGSYAIDAGTAVGYLNLNSTIAADQAVKVLDATIEQITELRANVGAVHNRLDYSSDFLESQLGAIEATAQDLGGADLALETANLVRGQLLQNGALAAITQANVSAMTVLRLLDDLPKFNSGR